MPEQPLPSRLSLALGGTAFFISLAVYFYTACPTVGLGHDTGELTCAAVLPGVAHPPGYPFYIITGHLWYLLVGGLTGGSPGWVMNLHAGLFMAMAVGFLTVALSLVSRPWAAFAAALLYGFATAPWRQAVAAEVFAGHLWMMTVVLLLALLWERGGDRQRRICVDFATAFVALSFAHHHTMAMAGPVYLVFGLMTRGKGRSWGFHWEAIPIALVCAGVPYLYLLWLSKQQPLMNWGNPSTLERLQAHVLRKAYGTFNLNPIEADPLAGQAQAETYFVTMIRNQFPFPTFLLILAGFDRGLTSRRWAHLVLFIGIILMYGPLFALYGNQPTQAFFADMMERFYASSFLGMTGLIALGLDTLMEHGQRWLRALVKVAVAGLVALSLAGNWEKVDQRNLTLHYDYMRAIYKCMPQDSFFIVMGDLDSGIADYVRMVEKYRPDLQVVLPGLTGTDWQPLRLVPELRDVALAADPHTHDHVSEVLLKYCYDHDRPAYVNWAPPQETNEKEADGKPKEIIHGHFVRYGPVWEYFPPEAKDPPPEKLRARRLEAFAALESEVRPNMPRQSAKYNFWTQYYINYWIDTYSFLHQVLRDTDPETAKICQEHVIAWKEQPLWQDYFDRGWLELRLKQYEQARADFQKALDLEPGSLPPCGGMAQYFKDMRDAEQEEQWRQRWAERGGTGSYLPELGPIPTPAAGESDATPK